MTGEGIASLLTAVLSVVSVGGTIIFLAQIWEGRKKKAEKKNLIAPFEASGILDLAKKKMKGDLSEKEREVIARLLWRNHQVPLTWVLNEPIERYYLLSALFDPSKFPWDEGQENERK
jgi:hypothetical protein